MCNKRCGQHNFWSWDHFPHMLNYQEAKFKKVLLYRDYTTTAVLVDFCFASHEQLHPLTISSVHKYNKMQGDTHKGWGWVKRGCSF